MKQMRKMMLKSCTMLALILTFLCWTAQAIKLHENDIVYLMANSDGLEDDAAAIEDSEQEFEALDLALGEAIDSDGKQMPGESDAKVSDLLQFIPDVLDQGLAQDAAELMQGEDDEVA